MKSFLEILGESIESKVRRDFKKASMQGDYRSPSASSASSASCSSPSSNPFRSNPSDELRKLESFEQAILLGDQLNLSDYRSGIDSRGKALYGVKSKPRPKHILTKEQESSFLLFQEYVSVLPNNFSLKELKAAWRSIARKTHPDVGGMAEQFLRIREAYLCLLRLF